MTEIWSSQRAAGALLIAAFIPLAFGVFLFLSRNGVQGGAPRSTALFVRERGSILAAVVLTAIGLMLLEGTLYETSGRVLARLGASAYFFGAVLVVAAEAMRLPEGPVSYPLIVIYVVLAFLGQAAIGGALVQSNLLPAWIGWTTIGWNVGLLVILGTSAAAVGTVVTFSPPMLFPAVRTPGPAMVAYTTIAFSLIMICLALIPLSITLSILRYRLWDVDVIINKALVYGTLTAVLAGLYFGSVVLLQQIVGRMAGEEQSPFVTVASTLLVAALFSPLRRNIQHNIDKRFFRRKYDVTQTLEAFNATIREGADLEELSEALLGVVNETMQPEHVSIWLIDRAGWANE